MSRVTSSVTQIRRALTSIEAVQVELDHATGWVLPDDIDPVEAPATWIALLPALDPTPMEWIDRNWYLGEHHSELFDFKTIRRRQPVKLESDPARTPTHTSTRPSGRVNELFSPRCRLD